MDVQIAALDEEITQKLNEAETMGEEGEVDQSMAVMAEVESLKSKRAGLVVAGPPPIVAENTSEK